MMDFVSWDDDIPNWMESHKIHVPNHQPAEDGLWTAKLLQLWTRHEITKHCGTSRGHIILVFINILPIVADSEPINVDDKKRVPQCSPAGDPDEILCFGSSENRIRQIYEGSFLIISFFSHESGQSAYGMPLGPSPMDFHGFPAHSDVISKLVLSYSVPDPVNPCKSQ